VVSGSPCCISEQSRAYRSQTLLCKGCPKNRVSTKRIFLDKIARKLLLNCLFRLLNWVFREIYAKIKKPHFKVYLKVIFNIKLNYIFLPQGIRKNEPSGLQSGLLKNLM